MLKDEIEKKNLKKDTKKTPESTRANQPNSWFKSWSRDNLIEKNWNKLGNLILNQSNIEG